MCNLQYYVKVVKNTNLIENQV